MERRTLLSSLGTGLVGLSVGTVALSENTTANASVSATAFAIDGAETTNRHGNIRDVQAEIGGNWSYELPDNKSPDVWQVVLQVGAPEGEYEAIAAQTGNAQYLENSGQYALTGSVTDASAFTVDGFESDTAGETTETTVGLRLWFNVFAGNGSELARAVLEDSATVAVTDDEYVASEHGSVSGDGQIVIVE